MSSKANSYNVYSQKLVSGVMCHVTYCRDWPHGFVETGFFLQIIEK